MTDCNNEPELQDGDFYTKDHWPQMRYDETEPNVPLEVVPPPPEEQTEPEQTEPDLLTTREQLLLDACKTISQDRNLEYGEPEQNIGRTCEMLRAYLGTRSGAELEPGDVCAFAIILKLGRLSHDSSKRDTWKDIAGYAAVGWEVVEGKRK